MEEGNDDRGDHDQEYAVELFKMAAQQGHAEAQFMLGHCNFHGYGVDENIDEAKKWYQLAADQGHKRAKTALLLRGSE